jgi:hypothetical protein
MRHSAQVLLREWREDISILVQRFASGPQNGGTNEAGLRRWALYAACQWPRNIHEQTVAQWSAVFCSVTYCPAFVYYQCRWNISGLVPSV